MTSAMKTQNRNRNRHTRFQTDLMASDENINSFCSFLLPQHESFTLTFAITQTPA